MSVKRSLIYIYSVQAYASLISILLVPIYLSRVGAEGFGLIGFFILLYSWTQILDAGVGGSLSRQISITKGNEVAFRRFLKQFYIVAFIFLVIACAMFLVAYLSRNYVSESWLTSNLSRDVLIVSLTAMFATLAFRYLLSPFRSGLVGLEKHGTLSSISFIFVSLSSPGGLVVLHIFDNSLSHYFIYQSLIAFLELLVICFMFYIVSRKTIVSAANSAGRAPDNFSLKSLLVFSGQLSLLSIVWVIVTQIDKLALSKFMKLEEFGYYYIAISVSGVITMFSAPLSQVLMPRLSALLSQREEGSYIDLYVKSFTGIAIFLISLAVFMFVFSEQLIFAWTGNELVAEKSYYYVKWLALGNLIAVLLNFIFILQYSIGKLKAHLLVYVGYSLFLIPASLLIAYYYKGHGAAFFWFLHNFVLFAVWGTLVHRKYLTGASKYFWLYVITPCILISYIYMSSLNQFVDLTEVNRIFSFLLLFSIGVSNVLIVVGYFWVYRKISLVRIKEIQFVAERK